LKPGEVDEAKLCGVPAKPSMHGSRAVFDVKGLTFSNFARMLRPNGRFVVDQSGLEGLHGLDFGLVGEICGSPIRSNGRRSSLAEPANPIWDSVASAFPS
jgi:hypothetical protein